MSNIGRNPYSVFRFLFSLIVLSLSIFVFVSCSNGNTEITSYGLSVENLVISKEKNGPALKSVVFAPGEKFFIRFDLSQYQIDSEGNLWIQEDMNMKNAEGVSVLNQQNLIDDRVPAPEGADSVPVTNTVSLFDITAPGDYTIQINVRDKIGGGAVYIETKITVADKAQ